MKEKPKKFCSTSLGDAVSSKIIEGNYLKLTINKTESKDVSPIDTGITIQLKPGHPLKLNKEFHWYWIYQKEQRKRKQAN